MTSPEYPNWVFELMNPMGGARATAYQDTLEGSELSSDERLAREAIQNSVDAALPGHKTEILIWDKALSEEERRRFKDILRLGTENFPPGRLDKLGLTDGNSFQKVLSGSGEIRVTIIEDRNTCGLGFAKQEDKDRFRELCLFLGQGSAIVDGNRGGSYGFGKTVYQKQSDVHTFFVYSVFEPTDETSGNHARFFGCSMFIGHHSEDGTEYTGRAWLGLPGRKGGHDVCEPVVDEAAHELARNLGFLERQSHELGTSIMIFGSEIDMHRFKSAVEDYWWPRLESDRLNVELWKDDSEILPPQPLLRPQLAPFLRCYELSEDDIPPENDERKRRLNAVSGIQRGTIALKALPFDESDDVEDPEHDTLLKNTVALIRSGPRMVVQYLNTGGRQRGNFAGTFVSHPDSEHALHLSEPPSHDSWNPNSERLKNADPNYRGVVDGILNQIKNRAREFQRELSPTPPPKQSPGTKKLEEILGRMMSAQGLGRKKPPPNNEDPFRIRIHEGRQNTKSGSKVTARIEVTLKDDASVDDGIATIDLRPIVLIDDNRRREPSERLTWTSIRKNGVPAGPQNGSPILMRVSKEKWSLLEAESEPFDRDLYADLEVSVHMVKQPKN